MVRYVRAKSAFMHTFIPHSVVTDMSPKRVTKVSPERTIGASIDPGSPAIHAQMLDQTPLIFVAGPTLVTAIRSRCS